MGLPEVKTLVEQAFSSDCVDFLEELLTSIGRQRLEIDRRLAEQTSPRE